MTFQVLNPATGEVIADVASCSREGLDVAFGLAGDAFVTWRQDEGVRRAALAAAATAVTDAVDELAQVLTLEQGKPLREAAAEVAGTAEWLRYFAELDLPVEVLHDGPDGRTEVRRRPLGVVAAITPWNFPLHLAAMKLAPALLAGNTVVLKPSPFTPLATVRLGELLDRVLPPHVVAVVTGGDDLGRWMTAHPVPRKVSFTGSTSAGQQVARAGATDLKRVTLELGGNDPAILLQDVDLDAAEASLFWSAFANNGQVCAAVKRVYAPRKRYDEVVERLSERARRVVVGDGRDPATRLGPVNNLPQLRRVAELTDDALGHGAEAVAGGRRIDGPGYFFRPTVLAGAMDGMRVVDEEQFGPVLPVVAYDDVQEVTRRVNRSRFGLSASVWSADPPRAVQVADALDCGTVWINGHLVFGPEQPVGGARWSGIGVENGRWGLDEVCDLQVVRRVGPSTVAGRGASVGVG